MEEVLNLVKEFGLSLVIAIGPYMLYTNFSFLVLEKLKQTLREDMK